VLNFLIAKSIISRALSILQSLSYVSTTQDYNYNNDSISDTELALGYESEVGLGAKLGHRKFNMEVDESEFQSNIDFSGTYFSVYYHF